MVSLLFYLAYHAAWVSYCDNIIGNIVYHNTAGTDYSSISNFHTRANMDSAPNPYVVADCYGFRPFQAEISSLYINWMLSTIYANIRADEDIITDSYSCAVDYDKIMICKEVFTDRNIVSKVAVKWSCDLTVKTYIKQQF